LKIRAKESTEKESEAEGKKRMEITRQNESNGWTIHFHYFSKKQRQKLNQ